LGGGSVSGKELMVLRLDDDSADFGLRTHCEVGVGTPVAGVEMDIINETIWLTSVNL